MGRPSWGRFISPDPIGLAGGPNAYAFVGGAVLNHWDPFGLNPEDDSPYGPHTSGEGAGVAGLIPGTPCDNGECGEVWDALAMITGVRAIQWADQKLIELNWELNRELTWLFNHSVGFVLIKAGELESKMCGEGCWLATAQGATPTIPLDDLGVEGLEYLINLARASRAEVQAAEAVATVVVKAAPEAAKAGPAAAELAPAGVGAAKVGDEAFSPIAREVAEANRVESLTGRRPPHRADWELVDQEGKTLGQGTEVSGGTSPGRSLSWQEQQALHSERKIIEKVTPIATPGSTLTILGRDSPCRFCRPMLEKLAEELDIVIKYIDGYDDIWHFPKGGN